MSAKKQILELLSQGLSPAQTAATLGVSESLISQLLSDEDFRAELEANRVELAQVDIDYDHQIDRVEGNFLDKIEAKAPLANLQQSLQAFSVLNKAKRRKDAAIARSSPGIGTVVNLQLNVALLPSYLVNGKNEIVEVEGKSMISTTPKALDNLLAERRKLEAPASESATSDYQLGMTKVERAAGVLQVLDNRPQRKLPKQIPANLELSDLL